MGDVVQVAEIESSLLRDADSMPRTLVLGCSLSTTEVTSIPWESNDPPVNVADFELVIVDFSTFPTAGNLHSRAQTSLNADRIQRLLDGPGTELVYLGTPPYAVASGLFKSLPDTVTMRAESGTNLTDRSQEFSEFLDSVSKYDRVLTFGSGHSRTEWAPLVMASGRDIVGAAVRWYLGKWSARMVFLPEADRLEPLAGVERLLQVYGFTVRDEPPDWLAGITLPSADELARRLSDVEGRIAELTRERQDTNRDLIRARNPLRILFETGQALEKSVCEVLAQLGCVVSPPDRAGEEDGTLITPDGTKGVLEIKGRDGAIGKKDVRQLVDWVDARRFPEDESEPEEVVGLLIGNAFRRRPPEQRGDPWGPNAVRYAERHGVILLSTLDLIEALRQQQLGTLEATAFWRDIFGSSGAARVATYWPEAGPDPK